MEQGQKREEGLVGDTAVLVDVDASSANTFEICQRRVPSLLNVGIIPIWHWKTLIGAWSRKRTA